MMYTQLRRDDRRLIGDLRNRGFTITEIAAKLGRHKSTISREIRRNRCHDGYRWTKAQRRTRRRQRRSRRNKRFDRLEMCLVDMKIREDYSPEQIAGTLRKEGLLHISHQTIYTYIWDDQLAGGSLWKHLRCKKRRRKRYGGRDSRGRLAGKLMIESRPRIVETRTTIGHWEMDTVLGKGSNHCILTLVERATGYVLIGKLSARRTDDVLQRAISLIHRHPSTFLSITADNGTEFHGHRDITEQTGVTIYFANPYHSWERGTNENTNGLIRQYLPKGTNLSHLTQAACDAIAIKINLRPRKRYAFHTPFQLFPKVE